MKSYVKTWIEDRIECARNTKEVIKLSKAFWEGVLDALSPWAHRSDYLPPDGGGFRADAEHFARDWRAIGADLKKTAQHEQAHQDSRQNRAA